jgi:hypothetical protein
MLFGHPLDRILTFQVKCAGGRSDKALRELKYDFGALACHAGGDRLALHAVALSQRDDLLSR